MVRKTAMRTLIVFFLANQVRGPTDGQSRSRLLMVFVHPPLVIAGCVFVFPFAAALILAHNKKEEISYLGCLNLLSLSYNRAYIWKNSKTAPSYRKRVSIDEPESLHPSACLSVQILAISSFLSRLGTAFLLRRFLLSAPAHRSSLASMLPQDTTLCIVVRPCLCTSRTRKPFWSQDAT